MTTLKESMDKFFTPLLTQKYEEAAEYIGYDVKGQYFGDNQIKQIFQLMWIKEIESKLSILKYGALYKVLFVFAKKEGDDFKKTHKFVIEDVFPIAQAYTHIIPFDREKYHVDYAFQTAAEGGGGPTYNNMPYSELPEETQEKINNIERLIKPELEGWLFINAVIDPKSSFGHLLNSTTREAPESKQVCVKPKRDVEYLINAMDGECVFETPEDIVETFKKLDVVDIIELKGAAMGILEEDINPYVNRILANKILLMINELNIKLITGPISVDLVITPRFHKKILLFGDEHHSTKGMAKFRTLSVTDYVNQLAVKTSNFIDIMTENDFYIKDMDSKLENNDEPLIEFRTNECFFNSNLPVCPLNSRWHRVDMRFSKGASLVLTYIKLLSILFVNQHTYSSEKTPRNLLVLESALDGLMAFVRSPAYQENIDIQDYFMNIFDMDEKEADVTSKKIKKQYSKISQEIKDPIINLFKSRIQQLYEFKTEPIEKWELINTHFQNFKNISKGGKVYPYVDGEGETSFSRFLTLIRSSLFPLIANKSVKASKYLTILMDLYAIGRMFKTFDTDRYDEVYQKQGYISSREYQSRFHPQTADYIIYYAGKDHTDFVKDFVLDLDTAATIETLKHIPEYIRCFDVSKVEEKFISPFDA